MLWDGKPFGSSFVMVVGSGLKSSSSSLLSDRLVISYCTVKNKFDYQTENSKMSERERESNDLL